MSDVVQLGAVLTAEIEKIYAEIPNKVDVVAILTDAHARLVAAAPTAPPEVIAERLVDVLREIATHVVAEFTLRTGLDFWIDRPDPAEDPANALMTFSVDEKGHVRF